MNKLKVYEECPICEGQQNKTTLSCLDHTVSQEEFNISECSNCGFWFSNPIPKEEKIGAYYQSEDYISHSNTSKDLISKIYKTVREYTIQKKLKLVKSYSESGKLLDIGCGTGEFLSACKKGGYDCLGIEPDNGARSMAINNHGLEVKEEEALSQIKENSIDVVSMWHVLEHVYHLQERVSTIKRILSKNGTVIIAVPNRTSFDAKYYNENWAAYDLPRHLYHFREKDIETLFNQHDLKLVKTMPMLFDSFYVSLLSEKYRSSSFHLLRAFSIGLISNLKAKFKKSGSFSSQIYILKKN